MSQPTRIIRNVLYLAAGGLISRLLMILAETLIARKLGPSVFGSFSTAMAFTTIGGYFISFGLDFHLVKAFSRTPDDRRWVFGNTLLLKSVYSIVVYAGLIVLAYMLKYDSATIKLVFILGAYNVLLAYQETFAAVFQAAEKMERLGLFRSLQSIVLVGLVYILRERGAIAGSFAFLLPAILISSLWLLDTLRECSPRLRYAMIGFIVKESYMFGLAAIFFMLNYRFDTVMLSWMRTTVEVGYYSAAYKFIDIFIKVPIIISIALLPALYRSVAKEDRSSETIYRESLRWMMLLSLPILTIITMMNKQMIVLLFNAEYLPGASALRILMWSLLLVFLTSPSSDLLNANNRQDLVLFGWFVAVSTNVALNLILIPKYGIIGASWATLASQGCLGILLTFFARRTTRYSIPWKDCIKPTAAAIGMMMVLRLSEERLPFLITLLVSVITYGCGLFLLQTFNQRDVAIVRRILTRK